jgi:hypothetical protein
MFLKHGLSRTKVYQAWADMKLRCRNKANPRFKDYGGRGIDFCDSWIKFENFFHDMGHPPTKGSSLDRIDNNKGYSKDNCKWSTPKEQGTNRRTTKFYTVNGERLTISQVARKYGFHRATITSRIKSGYRDEALVCKESKSGRNQFT